MLYFRQKGDEKINFTAFIYQIITDYKIQGKKLTRRELAKALGISEQGFWNKMKAETFTVKDAVKILDYLDMTLIAKGKDGSEYVIGDGTKKGD